MIKTENGKLKDYESRLNYYTVEINKLNTTISEQASQLKNYHVYEIKCGEKEQQLLLLSEEIERLRAAHAEAMEWRDKYNFEANKNHACEVQLKEKESIIYSYQANLRTYEQKIADLNKSLNELLAQRQEWETKFS